MVRRMSMKLKPKPMPGVKVVGPCVPWPGYLNSYGYGIVRHDNRVRLIHSFLYKLAFGDLPKGIHVDHLCRNRTCINLAHLEPVTIGENVLRGMGLAATNARKTKCKRGHPLSGYNLIPNGKGRGCRQCKLEWTREARRRERSKK